LGSFGSLDPEKLGLPRGKRRKEQKARKNKRKREPDVKCKALLRFCVLQDALMRSLSSGVFEGRTSTGSEPFSLLIYLDATKCVLLKCLHSAQKLVQSHGQSAKVSLPL